jgi:hypothetical protein
MDASICLGIPRAFETPPDPRKANHRHRLADIPTIAPRAVISDAEDGVNVAADGRSKRAWRKTFRELPGGIPSHATFNHEGRTALDSGRRRKRTRGTG